MLLTLSAALPLFADSRIVRRFRLSGDPRGIALGTDGTIYVGLAEPQAVIAVDPSTGAEKRRTILDSAEIASTKELVTLRTDRSGKRLFIANGSDESATILALPMLNVVREITIEGEPIRDALPDPKGRYLYLLGRRVHVYDIAGEHELRTLPVDDPTAIAANATSVAVFRRDGVTIFDTSNFARREHQALQSPVEASLFAGDTLIALARDALFQLSNGKLIRDSVCLPEGSGAQIATLATPTLLLLAERRCNSSAFTAGVRNVTPASLYGIDAYALTYDPAANVLCVTDRAGYLTIYRVPRAAIAK